MARYVAIKAGESQVVLPNGTSYTAEAGVAIVSSTNANPIVVTLPAGHGIVNGDLLYIEGHETNTSANGLRVASAVGATTVTLLDIDGNNVAGVGVGGATGTVRTDVVTLTHQEYLKLTETARDGDPVVDLGVTPLFDDDEVLVQGANVAAPAALTGVAPAALTANVADPDNTELIADVTELHDQLTAVVADVLELHTQLTAALAALTGDNQALAP